VSQHDPEATGAAATSVWPDELLLPRKAASFELPTSAAAVTNDRYPRKRLERRLIEFEHS